MTKNLQIKIKRNMNRNNRDFIKNWKKENMRPALTRSYLATISVRSEAARASNTFSSTLRFSSAQQNIQGTIQHYR